MNPFKKAAASVFACVFAVALAACGQSGTPSSPDQPSGGAASSTEQIEQGSIINLAGTETEIESVELDFEEGYSLVIMGMLESGDLEMATSKDGEWMYTDYLYEGSGFSVMPLDPAAYTIDFTVNEPATGTVYILKLPTEVTDTFDFENSDADGLIQQVLDIIG